MRFNSFIYSKTKNNSLLIAALAPDSPNQSTSVMVRLCLQYMDRIYVEQRAVGRILNLDTKETRGVHG